jgi:hypothetical protein
MSPGMSPRVIETGKYQKMRPTKEIYLAYVVAIRDPLNVDLDIYWPEYVSEKYSSALNYQYEFVSEELEPVVHTRTAYSCHLRGVEITPDPIRVDDSEVIRPSFIHMKDAFIYVSSQINKNNGWVLVSISDIDIYKRVLVNMFDLITRVSINQSLLGLTSRLGTSLAKEYTRPLRPKSTFTPQKHNCYMTYNSGTESET